MFLYIRSFITMLIGLYTSRVQLEALGIDNYGINNVVGGIVGFTGIITGSMAAASSRFITCALGEGNMEKMRNVFSTVANVQLIMGLAAVLFLEAIGVWFLNTTADIPEGRMYAANWVLQCSILSTFFSLILVPYSATIIAHEHMHIYAYMSIFDATAKLAICFIILHYGGDRLILFSSLWVFVSFSSNIIYWLYCRKNFSEARYQKKIKRDLIKDMTKFSGWNLLETSSWIFSTQGVNMLINVFFGVAYNAARGFAVMVNNCVQTFVKNFTVAFQPQIIKSFAAGEREYCFTLANKSTKYTWMLMLLFIVPICIEAPTLLKIWLVNVPPLTALFLRFVLFESLAVSVGLNLYNIILATGKLKAYTLFASVYTMLCFGLTWISYSIGAPVWIAYPIFIFIFFSIIAIRLFYLHRIIGYPWRKFISEVLKPCIKVSIISFIPPILIAMYSNPSVLRFFVLVPLSIATTTSFIYFLGLNNDEKRFIKSKMQILYTTKILPIFKRA